MRAMVGTLRADGSDAPIAPTATLDDIRQLATSGSIAPPVVVSLDSAAERLPSSVMASLHRIAIEALTNRACPVAPVGRHSVRAFGALWSIADRHSGAATRGGNSPGF
jgi:hypothetical protein